MRFFKSILTFLNVVEKLRIVGFKPALSGALLIVCSLQLGGCFSADKNSLAPAEATTGGAEGEPEFQITTAFRVDAGPDIVADASTMVELKGRVQSLASADIDIVEFRWRFYEVNTGYITQLISSESATFSVNVPDLAVAKSLVYQFIATDSLGRSAADTATLDVIPLEVFITISTPTTTLQPGVPGIVQLTLSDPLDEAIVIPYRIESGSAEVGTDIELCDPCEILFPPGVTEASLQLLPLVEDLAEPDETFTLTVSPTVVAIAGQNTFEFTILGDGSVPPPDPVTQIAEIGFENSTLSVLENAGVLRLPLSVLIKDNAPVAGNSASSSAGQNSTIAAKAVDVEALNLDIQISGTATTNSDFNASQISTIHNDDGSYYLEIVLLNDILLETAETVNLTLLNSADYEVASNNTMIVTIISDDLREVGSATNLMCVDQDSSGIQCWGDFSRGKTAPPSLGSIIKLEGAQDYMCALHSAGVGNQFDCWGAGSSPNVGVPQDFVATDTRVCGISAAGNASCVDLLGRQTALGAGTHLVGNEAGVCVTGVAAGQAECDTDTATSFANSLAQINTVTELEIIKPFQLNNDTQGGWCGVTPSGIICNWLGAGVNATFVPTLTNPTHLQMHVDDSGVMACVIDQGLVQSSVVCWNGLGNLASPFAGLAITQPYQLSAAQSSHICVAHFGGIDCVATLSGARYGVAQASVSDIAVGSDHICSVNAGKTHCWTNSNVDFNPLPTGLANAVAVEAELAQTCAKDSTGKLYCWGGTITSPLEVAVTGLLPFTVGSDFQCHEGAVGVACEGFFGTSGVVAPLNLSGSTVLAAGDAHACGLFSGAVSCWGSNSAGESTVPTLLQARTDITVLDVGSRTSCAFIAGIGLQCWGETSKLNSTGVAIDLTPPATGQAVVEQIAVGQFHICARTADNVVCWGENGSGQTNIPLNIGLVTDLAVGDSFTCVVNNGHPQCWGDLP